MIECVTIFDDNKWCLSCLRLKWIPNGIADETITHPCTAPLSVTRQRAHRTLNVIMPMRSSAIYARRHQGHLEVDSHGKPGQIDRLTFISIWPFII